MLLEARSSRFSTLIYRVNPPVCNKAAKVFVFQAKLPILKIPFVANSRLKAYLYARV